MNEPVRVLHVHGDLITGGGQTLSREWLRASDRSRITPFAVVLNEPTTLEESFVEAGVPVTRIFGSRMSQIFALAKYIRKNKIDVVHTQSEPDRKVGHWAALITRRPVVAHLHSEWVYFAPTQRDGVLDKVRGFLMLGLRKISERSVVQFVATSQDVYAAFANFVRKPMVVIEPGARLSGLDRTHQSDAKATLGVPPTSTLIINTSRLDGLKNLTDFIDAVDKLRTNVDVVAHIYGEGENQDSLTAMIAKRDMQSIIKIFPPLADLTDVYAAADIYLAPSLSESFGMSILEAMCAGVPVVAYNLASYQRYGDAYVDVPLGNVDGLTAGCLHFVQDEEFRNKKRQEAHNVALRYDIVNGAHQLQELDEKYAHSH